MNLHSLIVDDFLSDFDEWRAWADGAKYGDVVNPEDGVTYPGICEQVPTWGIRQRLQGIMGQQVIIRRAFLRLSLEGSQAPHQAHHDALMGQYSLMVYLNRPEHCQGGTELVTHAGGDEYAEQYWRRDTNNAEMWIPYSLCPMRTNRAFLFRASLWHRAMPIGGFGSSPRDGRLVYTAFVDIA